MLPCWNCARNLIFCLIAKVEGELVGKLRSYSPPRGVSSSGPCSAVKSALRVSREANPELATHLQGEVLQCEVMSFLSWKSVLREGSKLGSWVKIGLVWDLYVFIAEGHSCPEWLCQQRIETEQRLNCALPIYSLYAFLTCFLLVPKSRTTALWRSHKGVRRRAAGEWIGRFHYVLVESIRIQELDCKAYRASAAG